MDEQTLRKDRGQINCPNGLDADYGRRQCRSCGRKIMLVRGTRNRKAHWQHVGDGLAQYRSWGIR